MNSDIRLSVGFWHHPKTKKMIRKLGLESVRSLQILWAWAAVNKPDGSFGNMDWEDIELAADWQGDERAFFDYCLGVWIDEDNGGYALHDWKEHNPWVSETEDRSDQARFSRLATVNRVAYDELKAQGITAISKSDYELYKSSRRSSTSRPTVVNESSDERQTVVEEASTSRPTPAPTPAPFPSLKKEEKKKKAEECTEQDKPAQCRRPKKSSELLPATEFALPLNTGELWYVPQADYDSWCQLYPGVDVAQALRSMRGWCDSNPKRRKTKNGIKAFCTSWLSRDQNGQSQKQAQQPMAKNQYYPGQPACPTEYQLREQEQRLMAEALLADMEARGDTYKQRHANDDDDGKHKLSTYDLMEIVAGR